MDDIIGDVIFISFRDHERMKEIGIQETSGHYMLKGYDQLGLWLEHPGILIQHLEDENGRPLPQEKQNNQQLVTDALKNKNDALSGLIITSSAAGIVWIWNVRDVKKTVSQKYSDSNSISVGINLQGQITLRFPF